MLWRIEDTRIEDTRIQYRLLLDAASIVQVTIWSTRPYPVLVQALIPPTVPVWQIGTINVVFFRYQPVQSYPHPDIGPILVILYHSIVSDVHYIGIVNTVLSVNEKLYSSLRRSATCRLKAILQLLIVLSE